MQTPAVNSGQGPVFVGSPSPPRPRPAPRELGQENMEAVLKIARAFEMVLPNVLELAREIERMKTDIRDIQDRYAVLTQKVISSDSRSRDNAEKVEELSQVIGISKVEEKLTELLHLVQAETVRLSQLNP